MNSSHNLREIMQLLMQQYSDFVNRKERLENKALGYLTPLAILMAAAVAILIMFAQKSEHGLFFFLCLFLFFGQFYFTIWTFFFALRAYSVKISEYPDIKRYADEKWHIEKDLFLGGINNAFVEVIDDLHEKLERMADIVEYCRIFLTFTMVFGIINIMVFAVYLLQNITKG